MSATQCHVQSVRDDINWADPCVQLVEANRSHVFVRQSHSTRTQRDHLYGNPEATFVRSVGRADLHKLPDGRLFFNFSGGNKLANRLASALPRGTALESNPPARHSLAQAIVGARAPK